MQKYIAKNGSTRCLLMVKKLSFSSAFKIHVHDLDEHGNLSLNYMYFKHSVFVPKTKEFVLTYVYYCLNQGHILCHEKYSSTSSHLTFYQYLIWTSHKPVQTVKL